jgi:lipopolysaccharide transport protein LptA
MTRRTLAVLLLSALAGLSQAAGTSRIEADKMVLKEAEGVTVFSGHVRFRQPQQAISIRAEQLTVYSQDHNVVRIKAIGNPVHFTHKGRAKPITGEARELLYVAARDSVTLSGAAEVQAGKDRIRGERIEYDITTRQAVASGAPEKGGRFEAVISPKDKSPGDGQTP